MTATASLPTIVVAPEVQSRLCQLAFQTFTAKPGEGESRTGSLLGRCGPDGPEITGFSDAIEPYAVGEWSLHRHLPKQSTAPGLHIAVAPISATRASALIWTGEDPVPTALTFRSETSRIPKRTPPPETIQMQAPNWWPVLAATLLLLLAASFLPVSASVEDAPPPHVTLNLQSTKGAVRLQWRESGPIPTERLQSATLTVNQEQLDLRDRYQPTGELTLRSNATELVVTLRVRRANQPLLQQTITYVDPGKR